MAELGVYELVEGRCAVSLTAAIRLGDQPRQLRVEKLSDEAPSGPLFEVVATRVEDSQPRLHC